ncbi:MAG: ribosomal RNA small subunit methyltransferase A [Sandaracinaceae bacterium]|nr:ribosomal RNA small subunit methyltransferase A [Sandaracinaceae bacterium]
MTRCSGRRVTEGRASGNHTHAPVVDSARSMNTTRSADTQGPPFEDPRKVLSRHGLHPKRSFSQNFLVSQHAVDSIAKAVGQRDGQLVVELGPGLGTLTAALLREGARVIGVERDRDMLAVLRADFAQYATARFVDGDAADLALSPLLDEPSQQIVVAGNLPYSVTGSILRGLIDQRASISRAVIMVQKEVGDRLLADANTRAYGALSVFVQAVFDVFSVLDVPPGAFHPPPKVSSAVIELRKRAVPRAEETETFRKVVRGAFEQRRKTLRNALISAFDDAAKIDAALAAAGIDGKRRGETLTVEEFRTLGESVAGV